jgi:hypothetical protein
MFDDQTMTGALQARSPLVDPYAPSFPLAAPTPSITGPSVVAIAPVRTVSDRPKPAANVPRVSVPSQNRTMGQFAAFSQPPPAMPGTPISYGGPPVMAAPSPVYVAPSAGVVVGEEPTMVGVDHTIPPEGQRPFSDRPPPFVGADQAAGSVHPQRQRSFTPPLGVSDEMRPIAPPAVAPVPAPTKNRTGLWIVLAVFVVLAAIGAGIGLRFVLESGLLPH